MTEAPALPVARVAVDVSLAHLDRPFDYLVPEAMDAEAQPGVRVRVRFAGRLVDGFVLERRVESDAPGKLAPLERVVSAQVAITPEQVALVRAVADHYAGSFADVVRLAVPPRHAATEKATPRPWAEPEPGSTPPGALSAADGAQGFLTALRDGHAPRAWWQVPAAANAVGDLGGGVVEAVAATLTGGRSALVVVPDVRDVTRMVTTLESVLGKGTVAVLHADLGPSTRYRNYLACLRGHAKVAVGTRAAAFAPMRDLGLVVLVDDGDDLHANPLVPYPHSRTVAALRVPIDDCGLLIASRACSTEVAAWLDHGWMHQLALPRAEARRASPVVNVAADSDWALAKDPLARQVRLPALVFDTIRTGLAQGPVLVQVPRAGHLVVLVCERCRTPVRCEVCAGTVQGHPDRGLSCGQCGRPQSAHPCPECGHRRWRAPVVGASLTAQQLGRALPGTTVVDSSGDHVVAGVGTRPQLVVATPGAEPVAEDGYAAAVLLDAAGLLGRADLRAPEEALRRWLNATGLVRGGGDGGTVSVVGPPDDPAVQALVRADPEGFARRELQQRRDAGLPPAVRVVTVEGTPAGVRELVAAARLDDLDGVEMLGPVPLPRSISPVGGELDDLVRLTLRASSPDGPALVTRVREGLAVRSARKGTPVRVRVDPVVVG
ncbi:primosomal protein N' [Aestuariimicrobium ganziense]|uniref:primosomal protein N' n=1 Tax=Aestuariimicrobium ganziense TaxID=2773677 RepID=UPI001944F8BE|nr:primosomal protein N' [Aestuariimicrobium ganziense]